MKTLKYKLISNRKQYNQYCNILEDLCSKKSSKLDDEIDLLSLLINEYNDRIMDQYQSEMNPVELLIDLLKENELTQIELSRKIKVSPQLLNDVIKYRREITKNLAYKLSTEFKLKFSSFLKPYRLKRTG
jgi:HTH-type transcriptional regulator/antitoxin HigA